MAWNAWSRRPRDGSKESGAFGQGARTRRDVEERTASRERARERDRARLVVRNEGLPQLVALPGSKQALDDEAVLHLADHASVGRIACSDVNY